MARVTLFKHLATEPALQRRSTSQFSFRRRMCSVPAPAKAFSSAELAKEKPSHIAIGAGSSVGSDTKGCCPPGVNESTWSAPQTLDSTFADSVASVAAHLPKIRSPKASSGIPCPPSPPNTFGGKNLFRRRLAAAEVDREIETVSHRIPLGSDAPVSVSSHTSELVRSHVSEPRRSRATQLDEDWLEEEEQCKLNAHCTAVLAEFERAAADWRPVDYFHRASRVQSKVRRLEALQTQLAHR